MHSTTAAKTNPRKPGDGILQLQSLRKPNHQRLEVFQKYRSSEEVKGEQVQAALPSSHALLQGIPLTLEEQEGKDEVCNENEDQTDDHCTCCRLTNAFGTACSSETPATADLQIIDTYGVSSEPAL